MTEAKARPLRLLSSARLAAWLIAAQIGFLLLSFSFPQRGIFPDEQVDQALASLPGVIEWLMRALGADHVFSSPLFYAGTILLALNLVACTWKRFVASFRPRRPSAGGAVPPTAVTIELADAAPVEQILGSMRAVAVESGEGETRFYVRRGQVGFIGSMVLHVALVLVAIGGVVSGLTTFRADMVFTEGQTRFDLPEEYLTVSQVPMLGSAFRDFSVTLERMDFTYDDDVVVDAVANMVVSDADGSSTRQARVNYPLKVHGKSFLLQDAGHSVWLTIAAPDGSTVLDSFVNLATVTSSGYVDSLDTPFGELKMISRPDDSVPVTEPMRNGLQIVAPTVGFALDEAQSVDDYMWLAPGVGELSFGGYTVRVVEVRIWNRFMVRADGGRYPIYIAFALILVGAAMRFVDQDRWVRVALTRTATGARLSVWGARRYRSDGLPREGERILAEGMACARADQGHTPSREATDDC